MGRPVCIYAGSFDPVTNGHTWMVERGAALFGPENFEIAVAVNPDKRYAFTVGERCAMIRSVAPGGCSVQVVGNEFLVDFAANRGATHLLRGIRSAADFEYERGMRNINADRAPRIETVFLCPPRELCEVSSSMVKGLIGPDGWEAMVAQYVPASVLEALKGWRAAWKQAS